jgi:hypothetical protein
LERYSKLPAAASQPFAPVMRGAGPDLLRRERHREIIVEIAWMRLRDRYEAQPGYNADLLQLA